jgi:hypothetical protein
MKGVHKNDFNMVLFELGEQQKFRWEVGVGDARPVYPQVEDDNWFESEVVDESTVWECFKGNARTYSPYHSLFLCPTLCLTLSVTLSLSHSLSCVPSVVEAVHEAQTALCRRRLQSPRQLSRQLPFVGDGTCFVYSALCMVVVQLPFVGDGTPRTHSVHCTLCTLACQLIPTLHDVNLPTSNGYLFNGYLSNGYLSNGYLSISICRSAPPSSASCRRCPSS